MTDCLESEILDVIIQNLDGTCQTMNDVLESFGIKELTSKGIEFLDERIYCCSNCGWWSESGNQDDDDKCPDCQEEEL